MQGTDSAIDRRKTLMNLVRGAALAATLVPLAASVAEAGSITCQPSGTGSGGVAFDVLFPSSAYACETQTATIDPDGTNPVSAFFSFANNDVTDFFTFDRVEQSFQLRVSAFYVEPDDPVFTARLPPGTVCERFNFPDSDNDGVLTDGSCMYFRVEDKTNSTGEPQGGGIDFDGEWHQVISWFSFGPPAPGAIIWHDNRPLGFFTDNITESYDQEPTPGDPAIGGGALSFSDVTITPVPEPSSLLLLGSGVSAFLYRRRRQRSARDESA
jgi:hypothetical protein